MGVSAAIIGLGAVAVKEIGKVPQPPNAPAADPMLADAAAERARRKALANQGRSSTILTGPGGVTGEAPGQRKTLLGA